MVLGNHPTNEVFVIELIVVGNDVTDNYVIFAA